MPKLLIIPGIEQINEEIEAKRRKLKSEAIREVFKSLPPARVLSVRRPEQASFLEDKPQRRLI